jgi:hypothetical protein
VQKIVANFFLVILHAALFALFCSIAISSSNMYKVTTLVLLVVLSVSNTGNTETGFDLFATGRHTSIYILASICPLFLGVRVCFVKNTGFEIGKTGIIPVSVLTIQYRIIGNTKVGVFLV